MTGWPGRLGALLLFSLAVLANAALTWRSYHHLDHPGEGHEGMVDFHNGIYFPIKAYLNGESPYSVEYAQRYPVNRQLPWYSPVTLVLHMPFTWAQPPLAEIFYAITSVALIIVLARYALLIADLPINLTTVLGLAGLLLLSRCGHTNFKLGQSTLQVVLGFIFALHYADRRPWLSALGMVLASVKPTFVVPLVWFLICRGSWRAVVRGVTLSGLLALLVMIPLLRTGVAPVVQSLMVSAGKHNADPIVAIATSWTRIDAAMALANLWSAELLEESRAAIAAVTLLAAGLFVFRRRHLDRGLANPAGIVLCCATLLCIYHSMYDALLLSVPIVALLAGRCGPPRWLSVTCAILLLIPVYNYLPTRMVSQLCEIPTPVVRTAVATNAWALLLAAGLVMVGWWKIRPRES